MEEDLISKLPDDILLLILDKMYIYEAFQTTFVSRRWNNLWRSLPRLHFHVDYPPFWVTPYIISGLLSHRDDAAPVHDFHLSFRYTNRVVDSQFVVKCVLYAINHGVQSLRLRLHAPTYCEEAVFSCMTLRELELGNLRTPVHVLGRLSFPNLKTLLLQTSALIFEDDDVSMEPFSGLPELEKLTLDLTYTHFHWIVFKTPKLRVLQITNIFRVREIYAPLLTSFRYNCFKAWKCAKVDFPMLEQVYLDINNTRYCFKHVPKSLVRMLYQFRNATTVSLTSSTLEVLELNGGPFEQTPHPFPNMKCLTVIKRRDGTGRVSKGVMNYLMGTLCCEVERSPRVFVVEHTCDEDEEDYEKYECNELFDELFDGDSVL